MPLIGRQFIYGSNFKLDNISSQFNGITATFNITVGGRPFKPGSSYGLLVSLSGVIQEPNISYTISDDQITFSVAPLSTDTFFGYILGSEITVGVPGDRVITGEKLSDPFNYESGLLYLDSVNRRVGINTATPSHRLHVVGDARITGILTVGQGSIVLNENDGITIPLTNSNLLYAGQHLVNAPLYNTFTQTGSQYQAIVKGRCSGSSTTDIMSFGNLHNVDGTQNFAFHRIRSDGTNSFQYTLSGASGSIWHSGNDGSGSGLDADTVDGLDSSQFIRSDTNYTATGAYLFQRNNPAIQNASYGTPNNHIELRTTDGSNPILGFHRSGFSASALYHSGYGSGLLRVRGADGTDGEIFWGGIDYWQSSREGQPRLYFAGNGRSYYRSPSGHEWRNSADSFIGSIDNGGEMSIAQVYNGRGFRCRTGLNGTNGNVFNINWTGSAAQLWIDTTNIGTFISDYRVKKNIIPIDDNAIERVKKLRPVQYERRDYKIFKEDGIIREGFIAHEVGEVISSGVQGEKDDEKEIQSLNLDAIVAVLTKAVQEQQKIIESLQQEVSILKEKLSNT